MATRSKFSTYTAASIGVLTVLMSVGTSAKPVKAETFSIEGFALNTNNNIRRYDRFPEVLMWKLDNTDPDMSFSKVASNFAGASMLQNKTTQGCINSHYGAGSKTNVWSPCNKSDPDMAWKFISQSDGNALIQNYRSGLCLEMPSNKANYGVVVMQPCNANNANQRWTIGSGATQAITLSDLQRLLFGNAPSVVTSPYGYQRCDIWSGIYAECKHPALDIASSWQKSSIYSPVSGEVIQTDASVGKVAVYNAKANVTFFFYHMNTVTVKSGQVISVGTQVGTQGSKGYVTGEHLHFEVRSGKTVYMANSIAQTMNPVDGVNRTR